jgi:hypothetical protein
MSRRQGDSKMDSIIYNSRRTRRSPIGPAKEIARIVEHVLGAIEHYGRVQMGMFGPGSLAKAYRADFELLAAAQMHGVRLNVSWRRSLVFSALVRSDGKGGALCGKLQVERWDRYPGGRAWAKRLIAEFPERSQRLLHLAGGDTGDVIRAFLAAPPFVQGKASSNKARG